MNKKQYKDFMSWVYRNGKDLSVTEACKQYRELLA